VASCQLAMLPTEPTPMTTASVSTTVTACPSLAAAIP
jgi:hypothetical protein